jgi:hypothetical protein
MTTKGHPLSLRATRLPSARRLSGLPFSHSPAGAASRPHQSDARDGRRAHVFVVKRPLMQTTQSEWRSSRVCGQWPPLGEELRHERVELGAGLAGQILVDQDRMAAWRSRRSASRTGISARLTPVSSSLPSRRIGTIKVTINVTPPRSGGERCRWLRPGRRRMRLSGGRFGSPCP